ncbi:MAG: RHS repeat-associated core domain-containing protein, partial [Propionicimonas sp.]|nr:RHS repeat-associated core domain-containing protein [Propionicimonas sp.]
LVRTRPGAADERFSYHTDALGSVVAITSEAGTVVATYRYGACGELLAEGGSDAALASRNPLRYRAYYYDTHSALYYLPARYYDPASARFLSPDPAPASAGDPRTLDRYMYCTGDPVNYYDPTGAVIDVDGDGRIDSEDSYAHAYIHAPEGPKGSVAGATKYALRDAMIQAVTEAESGRTARAVALVAHQARAAAYAYYMETGGETPPITSRVTSWDWSLTSPQDDRMGYALSSIGFAFDAMSLLAPSLGVVGIGVGCLELGHVAVR